jgi:predicted metal-dependent peptidase
MNTQQDLSIDELFKTDFKEVNKRISKSKFGIIRDGGTFLAFIMLNLKHELSFEIDTAATDGTKILYNPNFLATISDQELTGLIAHELWHVAFEHMLRKGNRDHRVWNMAGDYVINNFITSKGFVIPKGGLLDKKYSGKSTEEVYNELIEDNSLPDNPLANDLIIKEGSSDSKSNTEVSNKVKDILVKARNAAIMAKEHGSIPGEINRSIEDLINPKLDWKELLNRFINSYAKSDFSWKKPNRRFMPDYYMPSIYSESISSITIAIDTSGSINDEQIKDFLSELMSIIGTFTVEKIIVIDCDASIQDIHEITSVDDVLDITFKGGGGTNFNPVFKYCEENEPNILIYFTDLYAPSIKVDPQYPVIWVCHSDHKPHPIGETYYYE